MGHLLTHDGLRPDPMKVKRYAHTHKQKGCRMTTGICNYLSRYLPKLAEVVAPLRQLTEKATPFHWQTQQEQALEDVKALVTTAPVLKFCNVHEEVTIQCDASEKGLGATLMQNGQPVAFASRALNSTEQAYAQIKKECMSIVLACERFDQYLHGRQLVMVTTDHKPLVPIFRKSIIGAPKRLQCMLLSLQKYQLQVKYCPGTKMYIADMLSRAYLNETGQQQPAEYHIFQLQQEDQLFKDIESINQIDYTRISSAGHKETHANR